MPDGTVPVAPDALVQAVMDQGVAQFDAAATVAVIRRYCDWHIAPPGQSEKLGPGGHFGYLVEDVPDVVRVAADLALAAASVPVAGLDKEQAGGLSVSWRPGAAAGAMTAQHRDLLQPYCLAPLA